MRKGIDDPLAWRFRLAARQSQKPTRFQRESVGPRTGVPSGSVFDHLSGRGQDCASDPELIRLFPKPGKMHFALKHFDRSSQTRKRSESTFPQCRRYDRMRAGLCPCCPRRKRQQYENCALPSGLGHRGWLPIKISLAPAFLLVRLVSRTVFGFRDLVWQLSENLWNALGEF